MPALLSPDDAHCGFLLGAIHAIVVAEDLPSELVFVGWSGTRSFAETRAVAERLEAVAGGPSALEQAARSLLGWLPLRALAEDSGDPLQIAERVLQMSLPVDHGEIVAVFERPGPDHLAASFTHTSGERFGRGLVRLVAGLCAAAMAKATRGEAHVSIAPTAGALRLLVAAPPRRAAITTQSEHVHGVFDVRDYLRAAAHDARRADERMTALTEALDQSFVDQVDAAQVSRRAAEMARASFSRVRTRAPDGRQQTLGAVGERPTHTRTLVLRAAGALVGTWTVAAEGDPARLGAIATWLAARLRVRLPALPAPDPTLPPQSVPAAWALTPAETNVAGLLLAGRSLKETASALSIALSTVQTHVASVYRKVGVKTRAALFAAKANVRGEEPPAFTPVWSAKDDLSDLPASIDEAITTIAQQRRRTHEALTFLRRLGQTAADEPPPDVALVLAEEVRCFAWPNEAAYRLAARVAPIRPWSAAASVAGANWPSEWTLTPRQTEVLDQLVAGASTAQIAERLGVRADTVEAHLGGIYERTGLGSRHLVVAAVQAHWGARGRVREDAGRAPR